MWGVVPTDEMHKAMSTDLEYRLDDNGIWWVSGEDAARALERDGANLVRTLIVDSPIEYWSAATRAWTTRDGD
jgi:hypothetical protein